MTYRVCPMCNQSSYQANSRELWICPHCGYDMTFDDWDALDHCKEHSWRNPTCPEWRYYGKINFPHKP